MASYKKRADGRYCTSLRTGKYTDEGRPIRITLYGRTIKELEAKKAEALYQMGKGHIATTGDIRFGEYARKWVEISKANKGVRTQEMYQSAINNHMELIEDCRLKDITRTMIQEQINVIADHPRTCEQVKLTISQVFKAAIADGYVLKNPCENIEMPRHVKTERRALTKEEKQRIREAALLPREKAMLYIMYGCGMRPAEVWALKVDDIDLKRQEIHVNKSITFANHEPHLVYPKTNSGIRTIQCPKITIEALKDYLPTLTQPYLFGDGRYYNKQTYYRMWSRIREKIQCDITPYTLRHNYCTELYYSGVSLKECQRLMGHNGHEMIMSVYAHLDAEKENTARKINSIDF